MRHGLLTLSWLAFLAACSAHASPSNPTVTLPARPSGKSKTTFIGRFLPSFDQDVFLGIKYADQPPRFSRSALKTTYSSNDSNAGPVASTSGSSTVYYNATQYGYECPGYGSDTTKLLGMGLIQMSEDCLNLNVIRPGREPGDRKLLPVMVWIFGGGWQQGATADPRSVKHLSDQCMNNCLTRLASAGFGRYNMSYIIRQAAVNNKPILGVSINYRLAAFGFLDSREVRVC
jgi:triacylglycerol lipase